MYDRMWKAMEAQDLATIEKLYTADAYEISASVGSILKGKAAILGSLKHNLQTRGPAKIKSIETFMETQDSICVESLMTVSLGGLSNQKLDVQSYTVFVLQANQIRYDFTGLISPRPPIIQQIVQRAQNENNELAKRMQDAKHDAAMKAIDSINPSYDDPWHRRHRW